MAAENQNQLVLAQNEFALVQDTTKGHVQVFAGPHNGTISQNERPVIYDRATDRYVVVELQKAIRQNPLVAEGEYLVLENPFIKDGKPTPPYKGGNSVVDLSIGSKINIQGPLTFPLWPGQFASVIPGHHLRSNQYLVVRVYNAEEATKNATTLLRETWGGVAGEAFTPGQLLVIKGTEASFFIPPTGFEVLKEENAYVREALTLERLEYAILLDEDGNKRYERGPQVVFPEATEKFLTRSEQDAEKGGRSRKFKAIELNPQMGLYIKVIADYEEEVPEGKLPSPPEDANCVERNGKVFRQYHAGEELFVTGKETQIYYPRPEHALIGYDDPKSNFKRERYYGITIPKGEGRYVLDKTKGEIVMEKGPQIFLPDPRNQVIVRRVLDEKACGLWYPGNVEALAFNQNLRNLTDDSATFLAESTVQSAMADLSRGMNRLTSSNYAQASFSPDVAGGGGAERMRRGGKFTPPPMLTLNNKYDGVPCISVWTGYAVQVVDRSGNRRVVVGPATVLLEYDETLEMLTLSTGRPKNTDDLIHDVYLRVDHNLVSDEVTVQTKDFVDIKVKVSYRVNFLPEHKERWFSVENYVKYLCDHMRSLLKADGKARTVSDYVGDTASIVRGVVLGAKLEYVGEQTGQGDTPTRVARHRFFQENGMDVYDVEVLNVAIADSAIATPLLEAQKAAVRDAIGVQAREAALVIQRRATEISIEMADLGAKQAQHTYDVAAQTKAVQARIALEEAKAELTQELARCEVVEAEQKALTLESAAELERRKAGDEQDVALEVARTTQFEKRMAAISEKLITALQTLGERQVMTELTVALAPLALTEQNGLGQTLEKVFKGSVLEPILEGMKHA